MTGDSQRKKVGLALGSGGARGLAHLGVLKVLLENNIPIDYLAGTSAGAFIAAMYAINRNFKDVRKKTTGYKKEKFYSFIQLSLLGGLSSGNRLTRLLEKFFRNKNFSDLKIPVTVVAAT